MVGKKENAIEASLATRGKHFNDAELGMALMRAKHLTRKGKRGSYEYIQKYPFAIASKPSGDRRASAARPKRTK